MHISLTLVEDLVLYAILLLPLVSAIGWLVYGAFRDYKNAHDLDKKIDKDLD